MENMNQERIDKFIEIAELHAEKNTENLTIILFTEGLQGEHYCRDISDILFYVRSINLKFSTIRRYLKELNPKKKYKVNKKRKKPSKRRRQVTIESKIDQFHTFHLMHTKFIPPILYQFNLVESKGDNV